MVFGSSHRRNLQLVVKSQDVTVREWTHCRLADTWGVGWALPVAARAWLDSQAAKGLAKCQTLGATTGGDRPTCGVAATEGGRTIEPRWSRVLGGRDRRTYSTGPGEPRQDGTAGAFLFPALCPWRRPD